MYKKNTVCPIIKKETEKPNNYISESLTQYFLAQRCAH